MMNDTLYENGKILTIFHFCVVPTTDLISVGPFEHKTWNNFILFLGQISLSQ